MTDLTPPPRRSPEPTRTRRIREMLEHETTKTPHPRPFVRTAAPWLAAAAVAAIAVTAVALTGGDEPTRELAPATGPSTEPTAGPKTEPTQEPSSEDGVVAACQKLSHHRWNAGMTHVEEGSTLVLLTDGSKVVTCNLDPDEAVSTTRPADPPVAAASFEVANNVTSNVVGGAKGEYTWAGGALPDGVTSVAYTFPDGHVEEAVTRNGYWLMQYVSPKPFTEPGQSQLEIDPISVSVEGPGGERTFTLEWGVQTCGQVTHGC